MQNRREDMLTQMLLHQLKPSLPVYYAVNFPLTFDKRPVEDVNNVIAFFYDLEHVSPAEDAKVAGLTAPARIKERRVGYDAHALLCLVHTQNSRVELGLV